jgi:hypothetical protein
VLKKRILLGVVLGSIMAGLATGCGGDDELSKEEYVAELNAMCEDFSAREKVIGEPRTAADLVEKGPRIVDAFNKAIADKVGTLEPPDEIADEADHLVDLADEQRDVLAELVDAAKGSDIAKVRELASKNAALNKEASTIARELGAESCADPD